MLDRVLLFLYSLTIAAVSAAVLATAFAWVPREASRDFLDRLYDRFDVMIPVTTVAVLMFLASLRFLYAVLRSGRGQPPSIDQRTDFGDIRISLETVEHLALRAAGRRRGLADLKARVSVDEAGLHIALRALVDGDSPIPEMTEEVQRTVKQHVEDITGIPVATVSVYVANVLPVQTFRARVE